MSANGSLCARPEGSGEALISTRTSLVKLLNKLSAATPRSRGPIEAYDVADLERRWLIMHERLPSCMSARKPERHIPKFIQKTASFVNCALTTC